MKAPMIPLEDAVEFIRNGLSISNRTGVGGIPITRIETISDHRIDPERVGYAGIELGERDDWLMRRGDILFSHINSIAHLGKCALYEGMPTHLLHGMNLLGIRPKTDAVLPRFLLRAIRSGNFRMQLAKHIKPAVNQASVSISALRTLQIPLPSLDEQRRIADILDKADAIRRKRKEAIVLTEKLLRSAFLEMFGDPVTNPQGWEEVALGECSNRVTKGESPSWQGFSYQDSGIRFVTSENVLFGRLDLSKEKYIPSAFDAKLRRSHLCEEDVLVNLVGASIGRTALVPQECLPANINQAVAVISLDKNKLLPQFLLHQLLAPSMQHRLLGNIVDAARANISLTDLRELKICRPPMEEQTRWKGIVGQLDTVRNSYVRLQQAAKELFETLIYRAFSGD